MSAPEINNLLQSNPIYFIILVFIIYLFLNKKKETESATIDPIITCILTNNVSGMIRCLEKGQGGPYSKDKTGESALHLAIMKDNKYMVAYLIKFGAIPSPKEIDVAFNYNNKEIIEMVRTGNHLKHIKEYETGNVIASKVSK